MLLLLLSMHLLWSLYFFSSTTFAYASFSSVCVSVALGGICLLSFFSLYFTKPSFAPNLVPWFATFSS
jgi:hypothetical protein